MILGGIARVGNIAARAAVKDRRPRERRGCPHPRPWRRARRDKLEPSKLIPPSSS